MLMIHNQRLLIHVTTRDCEREESEIISVQEGWETFRFEAGVQVIEAKSVSMSLSFELYQPLA